MTSSETQANQPTVQPPEQGLADSQISGSLDAQQIKAEAAALAAHLQRSGVQWLPNPVASATEQLASQFPSVSEPTAIATDPTSVVANKKAAPTPARTPARTPAETTAGDGGTVAPGPRSASRRGDEHQPSSNRPATRLHRVSAINAGSGDYPGDSLATDQRFEQLQQLEQKVAACTQCTALASCRNKTVFGEGNQSPRVAFFGEGPGSDEDRTGRPFVGQAGELLTRMLDACTFRREDVYILNTIKCRPPANRNPEAEELDNCRGFYEQQLNLLRPEYIVCLGAVSAQELLKTKLPVGQLRGSLHSYFASKVLVTYHPAYLLRNPAAKKAAWQDLQLLIRDAGIKLPKR